jgi:hypothetical protein
VDITDVLALKPVFGWPVATYPRFDLSPGGSASIDITDVLVMKLFITATCVP